MTTSELYRKHTSGTVSREKFLYEVRRDNNLPWILNTTSYGDAVKILKNKRIIFENAENTYSSNPNGTLNIPHGHENPEHSDRAAIDMFLFTSEYYEEASEGKLQRLGSKIEQEWNKVKKDSNKYPNVEAFMKQHYPKVMGLAENENYSDEEMDRMTAAQMTHDKAQFDREGGVYPGEEEEDELFNTVLKYVKDPDEARQYVSDPTSMPDWLKANLEQDSEESDDGEYEDDYDDEGDYDYEEPGDDFDMAGGLYENAEGVYGHVPNGELPKIDYDRINYHQLMKGMDFELAKMGGISDENLVKAKKKALDNIVKDSNHYRDLIVTNFDKIKKEDATRKMEPVKADNLVDKANGMKVIKKDAPAASDKVKKAISKKISVQVMTQTPKKVSGVAVMEVPKQEKVIALKESILKEFKEQPLAAEHFGVGARVRTKDGKKKGEITEFDGDTATVKLDNGVIEHIQANILTKREVPVKEDAEHADWNNISKEDAERLVDYNERTGRLPYDVTPEIFDKICDKYKLGFNKEPDTQLSESDDNYDEPTDRKVYFHGQAADADKYKIKKDSTGRVVQATNSEGHTFSKNDKAIAAKDPSGPEQEIKITGFIEDQGKVKAIYSSSAQHGQFAQQIDIDGLSPVGGGMRPGVDMGKSFEKYKALKEKLLKAVKETIKVNPKTHQAVATGGSSDDATAGRLGFTQTLPGNITPLGKTQ